jgi:alkanesulfonate monooxygenase SsuD/methylene tetrahydromethanopterin reductase-like flavin-dependent oxidoreductase (luciferase family)
VALPPARARDSARRRPLKIGLWLPETAYRRGPGIARWPDLLALARRAEAVGFDSLWVVDRLLFQSAEQGAYGGWECWSLLAALAAATTRVELAAYVTNARFRHPALLAKIAATVDEISGGRLILALGAGDDGPEPAVFGFPGEPRVARFAEALRIVHGLLREGRVDVAGRFYRVRGGELHPRGPRPQGPPILIGSGLGARMLRLVATYADLWNTPGYARPAELAPVRAAVDAACLAAGRDPATLARTAVVPVDLPGQREHPPSTSYGIARGAVDAVSGAPADIAAAFRAYARAGIAHAVVWLDPDTVRGVDAFAPVLALLDRG